MTPVEQLLFIRQRVERVLTCFYPGSTASLPPAVAEHEVELLRKVIEVADLGLSAHSTATQQNAIHGITKILRAWEASDASAELVKAFLIENLDNMKGPSGAKH